MTSHAANPDPNDVNPLPPQGPLIDPYDDRPVYLQVADLLRTHIESGQLPLGRKLPSETELIALFPVSRQSARRAISQLRAEGIVITKQGLGSYVARTGPVQRITLTYQIRQTPQGPELWMNEVLQARMPTPGERTQLGIPKHMPVLVITRRTPPGPHGRPPTNVGRPIVLPADRAMLDYAPNPPLDPTPAPDPTLKRRRRRPRRRATTPRAPQ